MASPLADLRKMPLADLRKEAAAQSAAVAKLTLAIREGKEKNTSQRREERRVLARMLTVLSERKGEESQLKNDAKASTVPARRGSASAKTARVSKRSAPKA